MDKIKIMKKILFLLLLLAPIAAFTQQPFELGAIKIDSMYWNESSDWVDEVATVVGSASTNMQLSTAKAVYDFTIDITDSLGLVTTAINAQQNADSLRINVLETPT